MSYRLLALAAALAFVLAACGSSEEPATAPTPTAGPTPTAAPTPSVACVGGTKPANA